MYVVCCNYVYSVINYHQFKHTILQTDDSDFPSTCMTNSCLTISNYHGHKQTKWMLEQFSVISVCEEGTFQLYQNPVSLFKKVQLVQLNQSIKN